MVAYRTHLTPNWETQW